MLIDSDLDDAVVVPIGGGEQRVGATVDGAFGSLVPAASFDGLDRGGVEQAVGHTLGRDDLAAAVSIDDGHKGAGGGILPGVELGGGAQRMLAGLGDAAAHDREDDPADDDEHHEDERGELGGES